MAYSAPQKGPSDHSGFTNVISNFLFLYDEAIQDDYHSESERILMVAPEPRRVALKKVLVRKF